MCSVLFFLAVAASAEVVIRVIPVSYYDHTLENVSLSQQGRFLDGMLIDYTNVHDVGPDLSAGSTSAFIVLFYICQRIEFFRHHLFAFLQKTQISCRIFFFEFSMLSALTNTSTSWFSRNRN